MIDRLEGKIYILVVEDEPDLCEAMVSFLELEGFKANGVGSAAAADAWLKAHPTDIIILDVGLPDQNGISWVRQVETASDKGLIVITALGELPDRIRGLKAGADAYLVNNVANRLGYGKPSATPSWSLNNVRWELTPSAGNPIKLTRSETTLLSTLAASPGQTVLRDTLIRALDYDPQTYDSRRMEILVRRLRNKIRLQTRMRLPLETIHGLGYAFAEDIIIS